MPSFVHSFLHLEIIAPQLDGYWFAIGLSIYEANR